MSSKVVEKNERIQKLTKEKANRISNMTRDEISVFSFKISEFFVKLLIEKLFVKNFCERVTNLMVAY